MKFPLLAALLLTATSLSSCQPRPRSTLSPPIRPAPQVGPAPTAAGVGPTARTATIRGHVRGGDSGDPVPSAFLVVCSRSDGLVPELLDPSQLVVDSSGRYSLELPLGKYELCAVTPSGEQGRAAVELKIASEVVEVDLLTSPEDSRTLDLLTGPR